MKLVVKNVMIPFLLVHLVFLVWVSGCLARNESVNLDDVLDIPMAW